MSLVSVSWYRQTLSQCLRWEGDLKPLGYESSGDALQQGRGYLKHPLEENGESRGLCSKPMQVACSLSQIRTQNLSKPGALGSRGESSWLLPSLHRHSPQHAQGTRQPSGRKPSSCPPPPVSRRPVPAAGNPCRHSCKMGQAGGEMRKSPTLLRGVGSRSSCLVSIPGLLIDPRQGSSSLQASVFSFWR